MAQLNGFWNDGRWTTTVQCAQLQSWRQGNSWALQRQPFCLHWELSFLLIHIVALVFSTSNVKTQPWKPLLSTLTLSKVATKRVLCKLRRQLLSAMCSSVLPHIVTCCCCWCWCTQCWSSTNFPVQCLFTRLPLAICHTVDLTHTFHSTRPESLKWNGRQLLSNQHPLGTLYPLCPPGPHRWEAENIFRFRFAQYLWIACQPASSVGLLSMNL